jgi:hypothetical protein
LRGEGKGEGGRSLPLAGEGWGEDGFSEALVRSHREQQTPIRFGVIDEEAAFVKSSPTLLLQRRGLYFFPL